MKTTFTTRLFIPIGICFIFLLFPRTALCQQLLNPKTQPQFINPLPVPPVIDGRNGGLFTIGITQFDQWLGLIDPITKHPMKTKVWGYNGLYPGPTILARKDIPIDIFWRNNLVNGSNKPLPHLLPIDPTIHWALEDHANWKQLGVPVVVHLHGGHSESASDGLPDAWFTPGFSLKGNGFIKGDDEPYHYDNTQEAATLWYHDHALGITRLNVYAGLAGYYLLTDENETTLQQTGKLPAAPYDLGLAIQERNFTTEGKLFYPAIAEQEEHPDTSISAEFFGDFILVNGMTWPILEVEPRQYRFRVLNGSDSRFYNLDLSSSQVFQQIGTDNGLLPSPVPLTKLLLGPGERRDVILDFSDPSLWGQIIVMGNNAKTPFPKGAAVDPKTTGRIMAFKVSLPLNPDYPVTKIPNVLREPIKKLQTDLEPRKLILFEATDEYGRLKPMLGTIDNGVMEWHDPVTENPMLNSTEIWEIYNETMDAHPIHLHLVSMQLINRQKFFANIDPQDGKPSSIRIIGQPKGPERGEDGWKDTWIMYPGEVTRVIAKFDIEGLYVWHCHILSHEDHEMMRPYYVGKMKTQDHLLPKIKTPAEIETELTIQALPNPFSKNFMVTFDLHRSSIVSVKIYDEKGSLIKTIHNGKLHAGDQRFNIEMQRQSNGTYFCEVIIDGKRSLRKMILQK